MNSANEPVPNGGIASRRAFLARLSAACAAAAGLLVAIPAVGLLLSPARREPRRWRPVGAVGSFAIGETVQVTYLDPSPLPWAGFAAQGTAWLRREGAAEFTAFSPYCTHVGCPVTWSAGAEMFMCPCHGGTFHSDGRVAAGPPPRPLDRLDVRVRAGQVEVRTRGVPAAR
jgi:menaquinol-cytochrome c reductase iron-sulfur subunit